MADVIFKIPGEEQTYRLNADVFRSKFDRDAASRLEILAFEDDAQEEQAAQPDESGIGMSYDPSLDGSDGYTPVTGGQESGPAKGDPSRDLGGHAMDFWTGFGRGGSLGVSDVLHAFVKDVPDSVGRSVSQAMPEWLGGLPESARGANVVGPQGFDQYEESQDTLAGKVGQFAGAATTGAAMGGMAAPGIVGQSLAAGAQGGITAGMEESARQIIENDPDLLAFAKRAGGTALLDALLTGGVMKVGGMLGAGMKGKIEAARRHLASLAESRAASAAARPRAPMGRAPDVDMSVPQDMPSMQLEPNQYGAKLSDEAMAANSARAEALSPVPQGGPPRGAVDPLDVLADTSPMSVMPNQPGAAMARSGVDVPVQKPSKAVSEPMSMSEYYPEGYAAPDEVTAVSSTPGPAAEEDDLLKRFMGSMDEAPAPEVPFKQRVAEEKMRAAGEALDAAGGDYLKAAEELGLSPSQMERLLKKSGRWEPRMVDEHRAARGAAPRAADAAPTEAPPAAEATPSTQATERPPAAEAAVDPEATNPGSKIPKTRKPKAASTADDVSDDVASHTSSETAKANGEPSALESADTVVDESRPDVPVKKLPVGRDANPPPAETTKAQGVARAETQAVNQAERDAKREAYFNQVQDVVRRRQEADRAAELQKLLPAGRARVPAPDPTGDIVSKETQDALDLLASEENVPLMGRIASAAMPGGPFGQLGRVSRLLSGVDRTASRARDMSRGVGDALYDSAQKVVPGLRIDSAVESIIGSSPQDDDKMSNTVANAVSTMQEVPQSIAEALVSKPESLPAATRVEAARNPEFAARIRRQQSGVGGNP